MNTLPKNTQESHFQSSPPMEYRRFGKTNENISVLTLGGMRFKHGWNPPRNHLPKDSIENCINSTQTALNLGINHIETAYGYMKSEHLYGVTLRELKVPRSKYKMMTKGAPMTADETKSMVEEQLNALQLDYLDFYGWHGINNEERLNAAIKKGGPVETLLRLKEEGVIGHVGFSSHAPLEILLKAINSDLFSFVNLHFYYFFQRNWPAVELAGKKDMGILIISPNDKGGQLWNPSESIKKLCNPLTPIQFNGRFCLGYPQITTLTLGMHQPEHFSQNLSILTGDTYQNPTFNSIKNKMDSPLKSMPNYCTYCSDCLPCSEDINIPEILRFRNLVYAYDMSSFGKYRYNMLEGKDHWFPGQFANACTECGDCLPKCPEKLDIPKLIKETHTQLFNKKAYWKNKLQLFCYDIYQKLRKPFTR